MIGQKFSSAADAMNNSLGKLAFAEISGHLVRDFFPKFIAAALMHRAVADDREFSNARCDEKQNAIFFRALVHAQMMEHFSGGGHGVIRFLAADEDADLAAHFAFDLGNLLDDGIVLQPV